MVDEEIEKAYQNRRDLHAKALELISCRENCVECRILIEHSSSRYLKRLININAGACKAACFETGCEAAFEVLPPYESV